MAAHQAPRPWDSPGKNNGVGCHFLLQCMKVKRESEVTQLCPTLNDPMDCSLPGSSIHGIFQARVLEWGAIAFSEFQRWHLNYCFPAQEFSCSQLIVWFSFYWWKSTLLQILLTDIFIWFYFKVKQLECTKDARILRALCQAGAQL